MNIDDEIRRECERRGWHFAAWETHPADAVGSCPHSPGTGEAARWLKAARLRRRLVKQLEE